MISQLKKIKYPFIILFLCMITLFRLGKVFTRDVFNDFNAYYDVSRTIINGLDPYKLENLSLKWVDAPIVFPGYVSFFFPFVMFDLDTAKYLYLALNIILGAWLGVILFRPLFKINWGKIRNPDKSTFFFFLTIFLFMNSASISHLSETWSNICCPGILSLFNNSQAKNWCRILFLHVGSRSSEVYDYAVLWCYSFL